MADHPIQSSPGARFRAALEQEKPLQVAGAINAYTARLAQATGFRALYLSGGGVAANSLGMPDLGISTMDDVLSDVRRITGGRGRGAHRRPGGRETLRPSSGQGTRCRIRDD